MRHHSRELLLPALVLLLVVVTARPASAQTPKLSPADRKLVLTQMKQALRQMVLTQSQHHETHHSFTATPAKDAEKSAGKYRVEVVAADVGGWTAVSTSTVDAALHCGIFVGRGAAPNAAVVAPTVPACWSVNANGSMTTE